MVGVSMRPLIVLVAVALPAAAHADRRALTQTSEYLTAADGQTEVELYTTQTRSTWTDGAAESFQLRLQLEHGVTDRWDVALSHVFDQTSGDAATSTPLHLSTAELRSRYRIAERGELPVDVAVHGTLAKQFGASAYVGAATIVVARDFGLLTIAGNAIGAIGFGGEVAKPAIEVGWAGGATYELSPTWKAGAESWGGFDVEHTDRIEAWAGPAVSWAPSARLWVTATAGFGVNDRSDRFSVRGIVGMAL